MKIDLSKIKIYENPYEKFANSQGSQTLKGLKPLPKRATRMVNDVAFKIKKAEEEAKKCDESALLHKIDLVVFALSKILKIEFPYSFSQSYDELCRIQNEAKELKCQKFKTSDDFLRCQRKFDEWQNRLDKLQWLP